MVGFGTCSDLLLWYGVGGRLLLEQLELETIPIRAGVVIDKNLAERRAFLAHRALLKAALTVFAGSIA